MPKPILSAHRREIVKEVIRLAEHRDKAGDGPTTVFINNLPDEDQAMLVAIMSLGRGDTTDAADGLEELIKEFIDDPGDTGGYLAEKTPLRQYLVDGLKKFA